MTNDRDYTPLFGGQPLFGPLASFEYQLLQAGTAGLPVAIDAWLGNAPGTTRYGSSGGRIWGFTGALIAPTSDGVAALEATLLSFAGPACVLGLPLSVTPRDPTNKWPGDYQWWQGCYFVAAEFVASSDGVVSYQGNQYSLSYAMIMRQIAV